MTNAEIEAGVEALRHLDLEALKETWRQRIGAPPRLRSRDLTRRMLAFEIQVRAYGDLTPALRQKLRATSTATPKRPGLQPGSTITRDWRGERHIVQVVDGGFIHLGTTYTSLSEVARAITGARWSGPRFFGLNDDGKAAA